MVRNCAICANPAKKIVFAQPLTVPQDCLYGGYNVAVCEECAFCYADDTLSQQALDQYYESLNNTAVVYYDPNGAREQDHTITAARLGNVAAHLRTSDRILDIGCGTGNFLALLRSAGYGNVFGLEPSSLAVRVGKEKYGLDLSLGGLFTYDVSEPFDFVILSHVLEHVVDLRAFIDRLRGLLSPGGRLYIEVPDVHQFHRFADPMKPVYSLYVRDLFAHFSPEHVNFFSPVSLRSLMTSSGFDEVFCGSQFETGVVASAWQRSANGHGVPAPHPCDSEAEASLNRYIVESFRRQSACLARIGKIVAEGEEILVWGTGLHTQRLLASGGLAAARIRAFVDSDPAYRGRTLAAKPILAPKDLAEMPDLPVMISSWKSQAAIHRAIQKMGLPNPVILLYPASEAPASELSK